MKNSTYTLTVKMEEKKPKSQSKVKEVQPDMSIGS